MSTEPVTTEPVDAVSVERWGAERLADLTALCAAALPDERVTEDDLEALCFAPDGHDPTGPMGVTAVWGTADGKGAIVASVRRTDGADAPPTGYVQLLVVDPSRRRRGIARRLVAEVEDWARGHGATAVQAGGAAPVYLFTGVDSRWMDAVCCFEGLGYGRTAVELDMFCPTRMTQRRPVPAGVVIDRVVDDADLRDLVEWSDRFWPWWTTEFARAASAATVVVARAADPSGRGEVIGAAAHSVGRLGVVGPVAVDPGRFKGGIGAALMAAVLSELSVAGVQRAEIAWVSTVRFYARACGAKVGRASQVLRRALPEAPPAVASPS